MSSYFARHDDYIRLARRGHAGRDTARRRLAYVTLACSLIIGVLIVIGTDRATASAGARAHVEHCHSSPDALAWCQWIEWMTDPVNAAWFEHQVATDPRAAIARHFGTGALGAQALRIAQCESKLDIGASSPTNDHGLFQINATWRHRWPHVTGKSWLNRYHADANARFARWLYDTTGGWSHWTCRSAA